MQTSAHEMFCLFFACLFGLALQWATADQYQRQKSVDTQLLVMIIFPPPPPIHILLLSCVLVHYWTYFLSAWSPFLVTKRERPFKKGIDDPL